MMDTYIYTFMWWLVAFDERDFVLLRRRLLPDSCLPPTTIISFKIALVQWKEMYVYDKVVHVITITPRRAE